MNRPVNISAEAYAEVKQILEKKGIPKEYGLRLGISGGSGCGGVRYSLGFDLNKPDDFTFHIDDLHIFFEKRLMLYLIGKKIEFHNGEESRGFYFVDEPTPQDKH